MSRRLIAAVLLALLLLVAVLEVVHVVSAGPFLAPTDGGYWGGITMWDPLHHR